MAALFKRRCSHYSFWMEFVLTLIASAAPLTTAHLAGIIRYCESQGLAQTRAPQWLTPHKAADLYVAFRPNRDQLQMIRDGLMTDRIDILVNPAEHRKKRLLLADMDATIVVGETLDDLAAQIGKGEETAAITALAMRGELDFADSLHRRVALLGGVPEQSLHETRDRLCLSPGALSLVAGMRGAGAICVLVSGGFTFFTAEIAKRVGFHHHHGNVLNIENGVLTGRVAEPVLGRDAKRALLQHYMVTLGIGADSVLAIGDGANDLGMLELAGLGIGYHPKPLLIEKLDNLILYNGLDAALYAQGLVPPSTAD